MSDETMWVPMRNMLRITTVRAAVGAPASQLADVTPDDADSVILELTTLAGDEPVTHLYAVSVEGATDIIAALAQACEYLRKDKHE